MSKLIKGPTQSDIERDDVRGIFSFHPATPATGPKHAEVREQFRELAMWVLANVPRSRERSLTITALQEGMMWANAGVAIHTEPEPLRHGLRDEA
jgi:hypothetical protein